MRSSPLFAIAACAAFGRQSDIEFPLAVLSVLLLRCTFPTCLGGSGARVRRDRRQLKTNRAFGPRGRWKSDKTNGAQMLQHAVAVAAVAFGLVALGIAFALS
jgi:hypothetical protein